MEAVASRQQGRDELRLRVRLLALWQGLERLLDRVSGVRGNPLRHLGAIGFLLLLLLALSGIYLYAVLETSAETAYPSIEQLSRQPWALGGLLRSLHRYSADAFVLVTLAHLLREYLHGHYDRFRRFSWLTGLPLLPLMAISAVGGFWLNWDELGQFSATASAELLDWLPGLGSPLTRNFLSGAAVSDRLFSLFVFIHLGVPLLLLFGLWFHIQRLSHAEVLPPRPLAWGLTASLLLLALAQPVLSHAPASMGQVPELLRLDWILLGIHPLMYASSAGLVWALLGLLSLALLLPPLLARGRSRQPIARVDPLNCNGCRRCFDDCPYAAVTMLPHPMKRLGKEMAQVDPDLCASCGICVGACPSSTPFRSASELVTGIDMPQAPIGELRERLRSGLAARGAQTIVVFGCQRGFAIESLAAPDLLPLSLICIGALPPSFVEYALRDGAAGVLVCGCRVDGCEFRLGQRWTEQRLVAQREPSLRASVPGARLRTVWADPSDGQAVERALERLHQQIQADRPAPRQQEAAIHG